VGGGVEEARAIENLITTTAFWVYPLQHASRRVRVIALVSGHNLKGPTTAVTFLRYRPIRS
jgi:hypothetical protein